jgi:hypothetical protein
VTVKELMFALEGLPPDAVVLVPDEVDADQPPDDQARPGRFRPVNAHMHYHFSIDKAGGYYHYRDNRASEHSEQKAVFLV